MWRTAGAQGTISLDVRDLDIYDAVRLLSTQAAVNLVVDSSVEHRPITLRLRDVTFAQALATLARASDLETAHVGNVIYLGPAEVINRRYGSAGDSRVFSLQSADPETLAKQLAPALPQGTLIVPDEHTQKLIVTGSPTSLLRAASLIAELDRGSAVQHAAIPLHYLKASDAYKALTQAIAIAAPDSLYASDVQNSLLVNGTPDFLGHVQSLVADIDRPGQQVRYDVKVTDIEPTESSNIGLLFGGVSLGGQPLPGAVSTTFLTNSISLNATLNALQSEGQARVLAQPSLTTLNAVQASLLVGQQYPIIYFDARTGTQQVQFVNVGVNLNVTPTIGSDGTITTDLETDYSQITGFNFQFPIISTRRAQSTLRVRSGETIVIAGLFQDVDSTTVTKVPFLGDIPILGEIFRNRQHNRTRDEIVFLISPHIVPDGDPSMAQPPPGVQIPAGGS
ncbi:MAG: secretin N-terminal domain-containing protein [Vulcanimicrobiaceae bacterium]